MARIISQTKRVSGLSPGERETLFNLLSLEFLGTCREDFSRDLAEKDVVVLLRRDHREGEIVGFSTLMLLDLPVSGRKVKAVFSGDTTVLPEYRTSGGIGVGIGRYFMEALASFPGHEIYYVLITKGWRTYKVLPFFFKDFAPAPGAPPTARDKAVMDAFGRVKYPGQYDPATGLIVFSGDTQRLVPGSMDAVPPPDPDRHVSFFLGKNPGYLAGTELVCVGVVDPANFAPPLARLLKTTAHEVEAPA